MKNSFHTKETLCEAVWANNFVLPFRLSANRRYRAAIGIGLCLSLGPYPPAVVLSAAFGGSKGDGSPLAAKRRRRGKPLSKPMNRSFRRKTKL